ncbi:MAG TPA: Ni/Fe-hydrogenase cytochrome b subunit [Longimicrobiales bacterium]|nr:Ni/Fe-hydrogenase cytochrome b subunit [Longimicrobiales bacterium]
MSGHREHVAPVGGPIWTPTFKILTAFFILSMLLVAWRFAVGIGPASALNDGYPWGAWKVVNVVVLTALGSGGYAMALLVYVLNRGHYHPLVRTAILTSALGYTTGVVALGVDIGRPWNFWRIAIISEWNIHSVLLEIAVCISIYLVFLWIEMSMPMLEHWKKQPHGLLKEISIRATPVLEKWFPWIVASALLLPTMHQSSLGSLFLLAGPRLHELWLTPFLPLLFLVSCYFLGYAAVVIVSMLSSVIYQRPLEFAMLRRLSRTMAYILISFLVLRWVDVAVRGHLLAALAFDRFSMFFLLETGLLLGSALGLLSRRYGQRPDSVFRLAMLIVLGGSVYRLGASLVGFMPGDNWAYFPSIPEMVISLGFVALAVMGYIVMVKRFPILTAHPEPVRIANDH